MDFDFSDDQIALRDAVTRWVEKGFSFERRQALARAGGATGGLHVELNDLGLAGLVVSPEHGGMGFGPVEAMVVMEELGRGLVPVPFAATQLVVPSLLASGGPDVQARWLPAIADGSRRLAPALQEARGRYRLQQVATRAADTGHGWRLSGAKHVVPGGDEVDAFVVSARVGGPEDAADGIALFVVERHAPGVTVRGYPTHDGTRAAEVSFADTPGTPVDGEAFGVIERAADVGLAAACAEAIGVMDRLVSITAGYLNTRRQFGVPIASFQALRHRMADVKMQLELARSMSYYATLRLHADDATRRRACSQAKVQVGQSMRFVGQQCVQLHGGIGVTDEYVASHYFKRLTVLEMAWGDTLHHLGEVNRRMTDTAGVFA
jgi:alkylation response protein AidB-like acyl-CoA dehydrogenase